MTAKACLIFNNYPLCLTDGGPSGFLAQNLLGHSSSYYHLGPAEQWPTVDFWRRSRLRLSSLKRRALRGFGLLPVEHYSNVVLPARANYVHERAKDYPWIWFHDCMTMAACLDLLPAGQKVILQSHCPQLPSEEEAGWSRGEDDVAWVRRAERDAFSRADVCVLPNEHSRDIYAPLLSATSRVEYLLSGCRPMTPRCVPPLDPQYIYYLYLGRRLEIKGFDLVLEAFQRAHGENSRLRLLIVGGGAPVEMPGVIDIGRSEEPASWLAACDYLVCGNRQSYFDLSIMEALSLGTPLIMTNTGGHRYFAERTSPGIFAVAAADAGLIADAFLNHPTKRSGNSAGVEANRQLYRECLTDNCYRARLDELLRRLTR
jgi:glycosyltransferase involved in cell wall biosynthesis